MPAGSAALLGSLAIVAALLTLAAADRYQRRYRTALLVAGGLLFVAAVAYLYAAGDPGGYAIIALAYALVIQWIRTVRAAIPRNRLDHLFVAALVALFGYSLIGGGLTLAFAFPARSPFMVSLLIVLGLAVLAFARFIRAFPSTADWPPRDVLSVLVPLLLALLALHLAADDVCGRGTAWAALASLLIARSSARASATSSPPASPGTSPPSV